MYLRRSLLLLSILFAGFVVCIAQQPGPEFWRKISCQPFEPRTRLESLEMEYSHVILRGFTPVTTVEVRGVRIDAVEMKELGGPTRARGLAVVLSRQANEETDNRAFVDYEEIDPLLRALDTMAGIDETDTKLANFEAHYHTHGDLEVKVFRQLRSGTALTVETGICTRTVQTLTLEELSKLRALIIDAKNKLDELK
ncbi:MAG TPA: hypothetical protein VI306_24360 [Pyrinomonadaceae bacterium]